MIKDNLYPVKSSVVILKYYCLQARIISVEYKSNILIIILLYSSKFSLWSKSEKKRMSSVLEFIIHVNLNITHTLSLSIDIAFIHIRAKQKTGFGQSSLSAIIIIYTLRNVLVQ